MTVAPGFVGRAGVAPGLDAPEFVEPEFVEPEFVEPELPCGDAPVGIELDDELGFVEFGDAASALAELVLVVEPFCAGVPAALAHGVPLRLPGAAGVAGCGVPGVAAGACGVLGVGVLSVPGPAALVVIGVGGPIVVGGTAGVV